MNFLIDIEREKKTFTFPSVTELTGKVSYCCFILFKNNKILLAIRSHSFYCSYIYVTLNKTKNSSKRLTKQQLQKISKSIRNLNIMEFIDFVSALIQQDIIEPNIYFSKREIEIIAHIDKTNNMNIFKSSNMKDLINVSDNKLIFEIEKILYDFCDMYFNNKNVKNLKINFGFTIVLPGGKKETYDKNCKETIIREVMEEINLNININEVSFLNNDFKFVNFKNSETVSPIMTCFTEDKILNHVYNDKIFIVKVDKNYEDVITNFQSTPEINSIFPLDIELDYDNMNIESLKKIIKTYKNVY